MTTGRMNIMHGSGEDKKNCGTIVLLVIIVSQFIFFFYIWKLLLFLFNLIFFDIFAMEYFMVAMPVIIESMCFGGMVYEIIKNRNKLKKC